MRRQVWDAGAMLLPPSEPHVKSGFREASESDFFRCHSPGDAYFRRSVRTRVVSAFLFFSGNCQEFMIVILALHFLFHERITACFSSPFVQIGFQIIRGW